MKISIYILLLLTILSCQKTEKPILDGHWAITYEDGTKAEIYDWQEMLFKSNRVELVDRAGFKVNGIWEVDKDSIAFHLENGEQFKTPFVQLAKDTIEVFENWKFWYISDTTNYHSHFENYSYELIGIKTDKKIENPIRRWTNYEPIHLFLDEKGSVEMKVHNRKVGNLNELIYLLATSCNVRHPIYRVPLIFIGKGIQLKDLYKIQKHIACFGHNRSYLVLAKDNAIGYHVFHDYTRIWQEEIEEYVLQNKFPPPPPPPPPLAYKKNAATNFFTIEINDKADFKKLENVSLEKTNLIRIPISMPLKDYFALHIEMRKLRTANDSIKYRTEIIESTQSTN